MDPGSRIILETTYEAIADAGIAPQAIRGTRTGVYCGINTVGKLAVVLQWLHQNNQCLFSLRGSHSPGRL